MGSYVTDLAVVPSGSLRRRAATLVVVALAAVAMARPGAAQAPVTPASFPPGGPSVRLQIRVFNGVEDVTRETRVRLYPTGTRGEPLKLFLIADQAYEADVPVGLYDVQAIREKANEVSGVRWVERLLVQKYPDEFGRHLQVINLRGGFGALQIRPEREGSGPAGWAAVATPPGTPGSEVGKAKPFGEDLLLVVPSGTYDIKVTVPNAPPAWITNLEIPDARTRLKTWPIR